jgi:Zn-dependent oligopeptidase
MTPLLMGGISTGVGLLSNLFKDDDEQSNAYKSLLSRIKQIQGYSKAEVDSSVNDYNKAGRTAIADTMNNYAIGGVGRQNMQNAAVAKMLPQISMLGTQRKNQMLDFNKELEVKKLAMEGQAIQGLSSDSTQDTILSAAGMGLQGFQIGTQLESLNSISGSLVDSNQSTWDKMNKQDKDVFSKKIGALKLW